MKRIRKSKVAKKRIFNESVVRYLHSLNIKYIKKEKDSLKHGRFIYWYEINREFDRALASYPNKLI